MPQSDGLTYLVTVVPFQSNQTAARMSHSHPDDPTRVHTQSSHLCPITTKLTIGQDTYTLSGKAVNLIN